MIYFDNNATTKVDEEVFNIMIPYLNENYGNPSSIYNFGKKIKEKIEFSRTQVAKLINSNPEELIFTSCATESNVTAIKNAIKVFPEKRHIITSSVEHTSIMETMKSLEKIGYRVDYLTVDNKGRINIEELRKLIDNDTCLVTVMYANNEIGNIYPIKEMANLAHQYGALFHCDAVQAIGKIKVDVKELGVDTLSIAGHKIYAPKGIGALYVKKDIKFNQLLFGHQEINRRGGTENVPYIIGLGKACELITENNFKDEKEIEEMRNYLEELISKNIEDYYIYGDKTNRIPNTTNIGFKGVTGDELMLILESKEIFVSTGSACNSEIAVPSHVLVACNADLNSYSPIRISLGKYNTKSEVEKFVTEVKDILNMFKKRRK